MNIPRIARTLVAGVAILGTAALWAQPAPAPQPAAPAAALTATQQAAVNAMNASAMPLVQAVTTARNALVAASLAQPANPADVRSKALALAASELELALSRANAIAQMQSGANPLTLAQIQSLNQPVGRGGRGGGAAAGPQRKRLLIWADTRNGQAQHEFTSHAMAVIERLGRESGQYDSYIRTDSEIISYTPQTTTGRGASGGPNLNNVDAIFSLTHREAPLSDAQKADLLRFVRDDGKGFVTGHTGLTALSLWPEFREMLGGDYGGHSIGYPHTMLVEDPKFPGADAFPLRVAMEEEWYLLLNYSREKIRVIMRLDLSNYPNPPPSVVASGGDFPVTWARQYGNGRVFASTFAHATESWDDPRIQKMYFEAIRWALKLQDADVTPRPYPGQPAPAPAAK